MTVHPVTARVGGARLGGLPGLLRWLAAHQVRLSVVLLFAWTMETAWRLPGDACYDLLNYHLYGPWALLHGKWGVDVAPAQTQTYLPPTNDLVHYWLARHVGQVRWVNVLLAVPAAAAIALAFLIALRMLDARTVTDRAIALVAAVIGATGAASHPVLATSMSDMVPAALVLGAVLLLCDGPAGARRGALAGVPLGVALGLKLTFSYAAAGLGAAVLLASRGPWPTRLRSAAALAAAAAAAALASGGWWWWRLWQTTGNPVFPLYNQVFQSPLAPAADFVDRRFLPPDALHGLTYPFQWAVDRAAIVTEGDIPMRDPRVALALLAAMILLAGGRRVPPAARSVGVFFLAAFALWERQFSIFRYLGVLELLTGPLLAAAAGAVGRSMPARRAVLAGAVVLLAGLRLYTVYPNWGRLHALGGQALAASVPRLPDDALVLLLDSAPMAYVALFEPDTVRFFGVSNNLIQPGRPGPLPDRIRAAIDTQVEHLYGLEKPDYAPAAADRTLGYYGLHRTTCTPLGGDLVGTTTLLCALSR